MTNLIRQNRGLAGVTLHLHRIVIHSLRFSIRRVSRIHIATVILDLTFAKQLLKLFRCSSTLQILCICPWAYCDSTTFTPSLEKRELTKAHGPQLPLLPRHPPSWNPLRSCILSVITIMADSSSFMDWCPPTPEPVHNPYQGNYMPGGWPVNPPAQPAPTAGIFAAKREASGILPTAKRVCRGLFSLGLTATALVSQYTISATRTVVSIPAYYVVRQVQQRQREQRHQRPRRQRTPTAPLTDSPWNRVVKGVNHGSLWEMQPSQEAPSSPLPIPVAAPAHVTASALFNTPPPSSQKDIDHIIPFQEMVRQVGLSHTMRQPKRRNTRTVKRRYQTAPSVRATPHLPPPTIDPGSPTLEKRDQEPTTPPEESAELQTPYPTLKASDATSPSPAAKFQQNADTSDESDSGSTPPLAVARSLRSNKRKIKEQGSRETTNTKGPFTAKRVQINGPSLESPKTPTPVTVVQGTSNTDTTEARTPVDASLLSPPRVRNRKVSTPRSSARNKAQNIKPPKTPEARITPDLTLPSPNPKSPESDISSTCDASPDLTLLEQLNQAKSAAENDISSTFNGTPVDHEQSCKMIEPQGKSPSSAEQGISHNSQIAATAAAGSEPTQAIVSKQAKSPNERDIDSTDDEIWLEHEQLVKMIEARDRSPSPADKSISHNHQTAAAAAAGIEPAQDTMSQAKLPAESDIASTDNGSFLDHALLVKMIEVGGGGSPSPADQSISHNNQTEATAPAGTKPTQATVSETSSNHTGTPAPESAQEVVDSTLAIDEQQNIIESRTSKTVHEHAEIGPKLKKHEGRTEPYEATNAAAGGSQQNSAPAVQVKAETSYPKTPERVAKKVQFTETSPLKDGSGAKSSNTNDVKTPEQKLAELSLEDPYTPENPTPKASPHSSEKKTRITRAEAKRLQLLEEAQHYGITPLTEEWEKKIQAALRQGHGGFKASDFTRVVPLSQGRGTDNWLNDEVINGYLKLVVAHGRQNDRPTQVPTHHAFVSFFYNNLESKGYEGVRRWAGRAKIGGKNLLETEQVFIPINSGMHWTLCVVSGKNKTITHYNSLGGNGRRYVETVKEWVKKELGPAFREEDWALNSVGQSPQQQNMDDCGVFTITSARQIMLGLSPMSYGPEQIQLQRRRIVAELVNGALLKSNE